MSVYRLKRAISAVARDDNHRMKIVTLYAGAVVKTREDGPTLQDSGLIDVVFEGESLSAFRQDLEERGERLKAESA